MRVVRIVFLLVVLGLIGAIAASTDFKPVLAALEARGIPIPDTLRDLAPGSATGAPAPQPDAVHEKQAKLDQQALSQAIVTWATENSITGLTFAVARDGQMLATAGMGTSPKGSAQPVASLSKAITAICANEVLVRHGYDWDTKIGELLPMFDTLRILPQAKAQALSLGALVTHSAGLQPDLTQGDMASPNHGGAGMHVRYTWKALKDDAIQGAEGSFFYSNTNFAVLGAVIEGLEDGSYDETCKTLVLDPAGVTTAKISGRLGSMSSFAGWEISADDYVRFYDFWFAADRPWVATPDAYPHVANGYGLGVYGSGRGAKADISHNGRLCFDGGKAGVGALAHKLPGSYTFVVTWDQCRDISAYDVLDDAITAALR